MRPHTPGLAWPPTLARESLLPCLDRSYIIAVSYLVSLLDDAFHDETWACSRTSRCGRPFWPVFASQC